MSESTSQDEEEPKRPQMQIDRYFTNLRWSTDSKKSLPDIDFRMNGFGLLEFIKSKSKEEAEPEGEPLTENSPPPTDPPWMKCCGRNFKSSIFSLKTEPAEPKRRSFSRIPARDPNGHLNSSH